MSQKSIYDMSDEDFLRSTPPPVNAEADAAAALAAQETPPETPVETPPVASVETPVDTSTVVTPEQPGAASEEAVTPEVPAKDETKVTPEVQPDPTKPDPADSTDEVVPETPNYEELYKKVMAPFKANGKTIELKDVGEVVQLMQMGANYTRNMQQIAPQRKTLMALQQAGINDPDTLNFLIDLHQKKPEAVAKLMAEGNINPIDIDPATAANYRAGNYQPTDQQVAFQTVLDDLASEETGQETIKLAAAWDPESQRAAFADPKILTDLHNHRSSGIYDKVVEEVNRARVLGQIPANAPFVNAYGHVFAQMAQAGAFDPPKPTPTPVAVRPATPKPVVSNSAAAKAAAPSAPSASKAEAFQNPLAMNDADFMKEFEKFRGRL